MNSSRLSIVVAALLIQGVAQGDVLILKNGGRLEGEIVKTRRSQDSNLVAYIVRLKSGARLKIDGRRVRKHVQDQPTVAEYEKLLSAMPDTAAGHWTMAEWCKTNNLRQQRTYHQEQVLRHDPNHADARRSLGFTRLNGKWGKRDDRMREQGYELFEGKYMLPQQIAIVKRQRANDLAQKKWRRDLKAMRGKLVGGQKSVATERFKNIKDPRALPALTEMLKSDESPEMREIYVDTLAQIGGPTAVTVLVKTGLEDGELEVRLRAIDNLRALAPVAAARLFANALSSKSNRTVNRAGVALGRLNESEAILPLIDALVTQHETIVKPTSTINPTFGRSSDGGGLGGLNVGGGPKKISRKLQNKSVLEALVSLTKQNYRYSRSDWMQWYIQQQDPGDVNLRRDS